MGAKSRRIHRVLGLALVFAASCGPARYEIFKQGQPWQFLSPAEAELNPSAGKQVTGYVFDVAVDGEFYATATPGSTNASIKLVLLKEGVAAAVASAPGRPGQPTRLTAVKVTTGKYGVAVLAENMATRFTLETTLKPNDPTAKSKFPNTMQAGPVQLGAAVQGKVAWPTQEQSHYYKITTPSDGVIKTQCVAKSGKCSIEIVNPAGVGEKVGVPNGEKVVQKGDWFVRVYADEVVDFADYQLVVNFESNDCDVNSGDDGDQDGAKAVNIPGAVQDSVDWGKGDCTDWYKVELKEKGKLGFWCKTKGIKLKCELVKPGDDEGQLSGGSTWAADVDPGTWYIKVYVPERNEATPYNLSTTFVPAVIITCDILETEGSASAPKSLIAGCGKKNGVMPGTMGVLKCNDKDSGSVLVDQVFPDVAKIKVLSLDGKFDPTCKVVIGQ